MKRTTVPARYRLWKRQRSALIEYALAHGIDPASRKFGLDRKTVRRWREAYRGAGIADLVPRYPAQRAPRLAPGVLAWIRQIRQEFDYGAPRGKLWLERVHQIHVSICMLRHAFRELGMPRVKRPRRRKARHR